MADAVLTFSYPEFILLRNALRLYENNASASAASLHEQGEHDMAEATEAIAKAALHLGARIAKAEVERMGQERATHTAYGVSWRQSTGGRINRLRWFKTERGAEAFAAGLRQRLDTSEVRVKRDTSSVAPTSYRTT